MEASLGGYVGPCLVTIRSADSRERGENPDEVESSQLAFLPTCVFSISVSNRNS